MDARMDFFGLVFAATAMSICLFVSNFEAQHSKL